MIGYHRLSWAAIGLQMTSGSAGTEGIRNSAVPRPETSTAVYEPGVVILIRVISGLGSTGVAAGASHNRLRVGIRVPLPVRIQVRDLTKL